MNWRPSIWTALIPLLAGALVWHMLWKGYAAGLQHELKNLLPAASEVKMGGFPYRIEARSPNMHLDWQQGGWSALVESKALTVHQVPWQYHRQVLTLEAPTARLTIASPDFAPLQLSAPQAIGSLSRIDDRIARLSVVWEEAEIKADFLPAPAKAKQFETHFRNSPDGEDEAQTSPPTRAELVLLGTDWRMGESSPLALTLRAAMLSSRPLGGLEAWLRQGTLDIGEFQLADDTGEVLRFRGQLQSQSGQWQTRGEIETVCPATVRAALAGEPFAVEKRARKPVVLMVSGSFPHGLEVPAHDPARPLPPVRGQLPDCPRLR